MDANKIKKAEEIFETLKLIISNFDKLKVTQLSSFQKECFTHFFSNLVSGYVLFLDRKLTKSEIKEAEELGFLVTIDKIEELDICECGQQNICRCHHSDPYYKEPTKKEYKFLSRILTSWVDSDYKAAYNEGDVIRIYP